jgi:hypothetical protein
MTCDAQTFIVQEIHPDGRLDLMPVPGSDPAMGLDVYPGTSVVVRLGDLNAFPKGSAADAMEYISLALAEMAGYWQANPDGVPEHAAHLAQALANEIRERAPR